MSSIYGAPLIEIDRQIMPQWQRSLKRAMDWVISILALVILFPVFVIIGLAVSMTSKGPVFFLQERIGWHGKPFKIIKFRTMVLDAEKAGPQLSRSDDPRITSVGKFLRKSRLDELPQFFNVVKGDMSLVGPVRSEVILFPKSWSVPHITVTCKKFAQASPLGVR